MTLKELDKLIIGAYKYAEKKAKKEKKEHLKKEVKKHQAKINRSNEQKMSYDNFIHVQTSPGVVTTKSTYPSCVPLLSKATENTVRKTLEPYIVKKQKERLYYKTLEVDKSKIAINKIKIAEVK